MTRKNQPRIEVVLLCACVHKCEKRGPLPAQSEQ